jgi:DNA-binding SARP family transcriptional activator/tetratricopeptide (TPR) repeat protein
MLCIRLLGGIQAEMDGHAVPAPTSRRAWALLGWLALHPGLHSRASVAARLWPDVVDTSARQSMRSALWSLRQVLDGVAPAALVTTRDRVGLAADVEVDVRRFDELVKAGRLHDAVAMGDGDLLAGVDDEWALVARDEHRDRLTIVLGALSTQAQHSGDRGTAAAFARRAAALDPLSEEAARALMARLAEAGDRPAALASYQRLAERLRRELRVAPSEPTWRLAEQIRTHVPPVSEVRAPRARPGVVQLIGRQSEHRALVAAWSATLAGHGGFALIHGDPGIGKSRLVAELIDAVARDGALVAVGWVPDFAGAPLSPWVEICAALAGQLGALPQAPWVTTLAPLLPALVAPSRSETPPGLAQARMSEAVLTLMEECARRGPVLVVIEDLHAADEASLAMLAYVSRRVGAERVLVLGTRRDRPRRDRLALLEQAHRQVGTLRADIALRVLESTAISELARAVGPLADDAVLRVVEVAEGNALLAVEAARTLAAGDPLPVGLRGAVRAAAARLPDNARALLSAVAVAGRDVEPAEAAQLAGVELAQALPPAEDEGLIVYAGDRLRFRHALLREAVYADLPPAERVERHARAAELLQAGGAVDRAAEAAAHLRRAGRPREAGELLIQAAARARRLGALADATDLLREASAALPEDPIAVLELADVLAWRGRPADAREVFDRALPLLEVAGDAAVVAAAHLRYAEWHYGPICQPRIATQACRRALAVLDGAGLPERELRGQVLAAYAWCESLDGDPDVVAQTLALLAAVAGEQPDDPLLASGADRARSFILLRQARFAEAVEPGVRAADAAVRANRPDLAYSALVNAAYALTASGDYIGALGLLDRAASELRGRGMLAIETLVLVYRAWVLVRLGRFADAGEAALQARRCADRLDAPDLQAVVDAERGRLAIRAGDFELAQQLLGAGLATPGAGIGRPLAQLQRADALARCDRLDEAEAALAAVALEPVGPGDWPDTLVARAAAVQGVIAVGRGDPNSARRLFEQAAAGWRRRLSPIELAQRMASVLADLGRPIIGLVVPAEELAAIEADLAALPATMEVSDADVR